MTKEKLDKIKETYPKNTVFIRFNNDEIISAEPFDKYAKMGKTYEQCIQALKNNPLYREIQDDITYQITKLLDKALHKSALSEELANCLRSIASDIDDVLEILDD